MSQRFEVVHDDIQGVLGTAVAGATSWTPLQYRTTGIVFNGVRQSDKDVFTMVFQMPHRKKLQTPIDSVHLHWITEVAKTGSWNLNYAWGWYDEEGGVAIPATLPNTGTVSVSVAAADQYIPKMTSLIINLAPPTVETYSSILYVKFQLNNVSGGVAGGDYLLIRYLDAHFEVDRLGSINEASD